MTLLIWEYLKEIINPLLTASIRVIYILQKYLICFLQEIKKALHAVHEGLTNYL